MQRKVAVAHVAAERPQSVLRAWHALPSAKSPNRYRSSAATPPAHCDLALAVAALWLPAYPSVDGFA